MKKFVKVSLITAGGLAALGCVLCLVSGLIGGRGFWYWVGNDRYMTEKLDRMANQLGDISNSIDVDFGTWHFGWNERNGGLEAWEDAYSVPADDIRNLELTLGAGRFIVREKEASDGVIEISMKGIGKCSQYIEDGTLHVEGFKGLKVLGNEAASNLIIVEIPSGKSFHEIEVTIGAGIMEISAIKVNEIDVTIGAGELTMKEIDAEDFSAEIGAGRLETENISTREADLSVGMGECIFRGAVLKDLDAECNMGNMELYLKGEEKDYNYDVECAAGNISVGGLSFTALDAERRIDNGAGGTLEISCTMGNVAVYFEK